MIRWLLWKDLRLMTPALLAAGLLFAASFLSTFAFMYSMSIGPFPWADAVVTGTHVFQWSMVLVSALIGGSALSREREDQSVRFFLSLPLRRRDALLSKLVVTLLIVELLWICIALIVHASVPWAAFDVRDKLPAAAGMGTVASFSLLALGASWCWSSVLAKPALAALNGLVTVGVVAIAVRGTMALEAGAGGIVTLGDIAPWATLVGIVGVALGSRLYLAGDAESSGLPTHRATSAGEQFPHRFSALASTSPWNRTTGFRALLWKDWHMIKTVLLSGGFVLVTPYLYASFILLTSGAGLHAFARASTQSLWLSCIVFPLWGGYLVSTERATGTDHFLGSMPVASLRIGASRLLTTFLPAVIVFIATIGASIALHQQAFKPSPVETSPVGFLHMTWSVLIFQPDSLLFGLPAYGAPLVCYGVSWLGSNALDKPFLGVVFGAATAGMVLVLWLAAIPITQELLAPIQLAFLFLTAGSVAAVAFVGLGCRALKSAQEG